jgi:hypothetical protein
VILFSSFFYCFILFFYRFGFGAGGTEIGRKEALRETGRIRSWEFGSALSKFGFFNSRKRKF